MNLYFMILIMNKIIKQLKGQQFFKGKNMFGDLLFTYVFITIAIVVLLAIL